MVFTKSAFDLSQCARPNILSLQPYRCARDDYKDNGTNILLDANENAYGPSLSLQSSRPVGQNGINGIESLTTPDMKLLLGLNRYPDPHQIELKQMLCSLRNNHTYASITLRPENLFVGVGSDEAIDAILRCFCIPGRDKILTCPPTYGMYAVSAHVNDLEVVKVALDVSNAFSLQPDAVNEKLAQDPHIKVVYVCSPGNPTGSLISKPAIQKILEHPKWNGVVVVDEAYIDFAPEGSSLASWVTEWPNLIVLQTFSKGFGLAGIRLGTAFTSPEIAALLNNLKAPYNISTISSALACQAMQPESLDVMRSNRSRIVKQRERMLAELPKIPGIGRFLGGTESNFLLMEILDKPRNRGGSPNNKTALAVYEGLAENKGVVVRFRGNEPGCYGCLRITVGREDEVDKFLKEIGSVLEEAYRGRLDMSSGIEEAQAANAIVA